jgi:hypothetical protein
MHAPTNDRADRNQGRYNGWQESDRALDRPDTLSKESIDTSLSNDEILLMTELSWQRRRLCAIEYSQFLFLVKCHMKSHLAENSQSLISRDSS